jgi:hypothetical protein
MSLYDSSGKVLFDAVLPRPDLSYRATVEPWVGTPLYPPAGAARQQGGRTTVFASWNGATKVAGWRVLGGQSGGALGTIASAQKLGFETAIKVPAGYSTYKVQAVDPSNRVLGTSQAFKPSG